MIWGIAKLIGAPLAAALAVALGWVWISDAFTIRTLRNDLTTVTARRDRLETAIFGPTGWRVRLDTAEKSVKGLRIRVTQQNDAIADLVLESEKRDRDADAALAAARKDRDRIEAGYTAILNQPPQSDIAKQALDIVFGNIPR